MNEKQLDEILELPIDDRMMIVQVIWDSIAEDGGVELTEEQDAELRRRLTKYRENPANVSSWDDAKGRILQRLKRL